MDNAKHDEFTKRFPVTVITGSGAILLVAPNAAKAYVLGVPSDGAIIPTRTDRQARTVARQVCWLLDAGAESMRRTDGLTVLASGYVHP